VKDIQDACKLFEPIYDQTDGGDGYVSVEVSPRLADDTEGTVEAAKWLYKVVDRRNVYIKIPATAACVPSIKDVISLGISVNVTVSSSSNSYTSMLSLKEIAHKTFEQHILVICFKLSWIAFGHDLDLSMSSVWHSVVRTITLKFMMAM
jgi:hypothetical protein